MEHVELAGAIQPGMSAGEKSLIPCTKVLGVVVRGIGNWEEWRRVDIRNGWLSDKGDRKTRLFLSDARRT